MTIQDPDRGLSSIVSSTDRLPMAAVPDFWDRSGTGLYRANFDGHFLAVNHAYARILDYNSPEHLIRQVTCIGQEVYQSPTRWGELLSFLQKEEFIRGFESPVWTRCHSVRWLMESVRLVSDEHHGRYILEGMVYDITDRKMIELDREYDLIHLSKCVGERSRG
jgi:adenylate cyclase